MKTYVDVVMIIKAAKKALILMEEPVNSSTLKKIIKILGDEVVKYAILDEEESNDYVESIDFVYHSLIGFNSRIDHNEYNFDKSLKRLWLRLKMELTCIVIRHPECSYQISL